MQVNYRFYATLLDGFQYYLSKVADDNAFQDFIDRLNRKPFYSEAAAKGTAFNELVDLIISGKIRIEDLPKDKRGNVLYTYTEQEHKKDFPFKPEIVALFAQKLAGAIPQKYIEAVLPTRSLAEAWLDLIASARFEVAPERLMVKMKTIQIRRGELRASQRFLAKRWNWSVGKVNRFMNLLEDEGMIERRQEHSETIVSIANYDLYNPLKKAEDEHRRISEMEDFGEKNEDCGFKNEQQCEHQKNAKTFTIPNVQKLGELNNEHQKDAKLNKRGSPTDHQRRQTKESKEGRERKEVYGEIIDFFNETCVSLPSVKLTPKRRGNIRARIREHSIPEVYEMIENAAASSFLAGQNRRDWQATFDWLFRPNNFVKVLEGNYLDRLTISPDGNRISLITDLAGDVAGVMDYPGSTSQVGGYTYDANGNLTQETNKLMSFNYNLLNLPREVNYWAGANAKIKYYYTFDGEKLRKTVENNGIVTKVDYCGPFVYETASGVRSLKYFVTPEGRAVKNGSTWDYEYNLKDHLGNTRVVIKSNSGVAQVVQERHYYPFGMEMSELSYGTGTNKYLYNSKEIQNDFDLYWYDYGARFYDPQLGRWHSVDPLAEQYQGFSPYNYAANNPIRFIDPDGRIVRPAPGSRPEFIQNYQKAVKILSEKGVGNSFQQLVRSKEVYYVKENGISQYDFKDYTNKTINWNPSAALEVNGKIVLSPAGVFGHEIEHAVNHDNALKVYYNGDETSYNKWENGLYRDETNPFRKKEEENVITGPEQTIAKALGSIGQSETTRNDSSGQMVRVDGINSTEKPKSLTPIKPIQPELKINKEFE